MARNSLAKETTKPKASINWDEVDELLEAQCSGTEIAAYFSIHHDTFYRAVEEKYGIGFTAYKQSKSDKGKGNLRLAQYQLALQKDRGMLIHLGEHILEQTKKTQVEHAGSININRVDYTTAQLADNNAADADAKAVPDPVVELPRQGG